MCKNYNVIGTDKAKEELKYFLQTSNLERSKIKLYLVEKCTNKHYYFNKPVLNSTIGQNICRNNIKLLNSILRDKLIVEFNPVHIIEETIDCLNANDVDGFKIMMADIIDSDNINNNMNELEVEQLTFYLIDITIDEKNIKFFRRYTNAKTLKKRSTPYRILDNSLHEMKDELFFIDNIVDVAIINNQHILVLNRYSFEIIMNYKDNYLNNLQKALEIIKSSNLIENFNDFRDDCMDSIAIAKKFTNIMKKDNITVIKNNISKVPKAIERADIPVDFKNNKIIYKDKSEIYYIIDILSDSFAETLIGNKITNTF